MTYKNGRTPAINDTIVGRQDGKGIITGIVIAVTPPNPKIANDAGSLTINSLWLVRPLTANNTGGALHVDPVVVTASNFFHAEDALAAGIANVNAQAQLAATQAQTTAQDATQK